VKGAGLLLILLGSFSIVGGDGLWVVLAGAGIITLDYLYG
jgi:hypothetical protein